MKVAFSLLMLFLIIQVDSYDSPRKDKCVRQLRGKVTTYITEKQLVTLLDKQTEKIRGGKTADEVAAGFKDGILGTFAPTQYMDIINKGLPCNSALRNIIIFNRLNNLGVVIHNNLLAFLTQICHIFQVYKNKGMADKACDARGFGKVTQFVTDKRMNTIFCRFRSHYTDKQWAGIYKNFKTIFILDNYPCCIPPSSG